jgi:hypothetical protein
MLRGDVQLVFITFESVLSKLVNRKMLLLKQDHQRLWNFKTTFLITNNFSPAEFVTAALLTRRRNILVTGGESSLQRKVEKLLKEDENGENDIDGEDENENGEGDGV